MQAVIPLPAAVALIALASELDHIAAPGLQPTCCTSVSAFLCCDPLPAGRSSISWLLPMHKH